MIFETNLIFSTYDFINSERKFKLLSRNLSTKLSLTFFALFQTKYKSQSLSDEDSRVRISYLFIVHGRSLRQVLRLFKHLYNPEDYFYFHVDSRSEYLYGNLKSLETENGFENIKVTEKRFATIWGGASLLQMMVSAMREMLELQWNFDFVINLSESDYILKHPKYLKKFLAPQKGMNFVKSHGRDTETFIKKQGMFIDCWNKTEKAFSQWTWVLCLF